jgi:hypothetical protein
MAGTVQPVQTCVDTGIVPTDLHASLALQNEIPINARTLIIITSVTGPVNVTIKNQVTVDGQLAPDRVVNVATAATKLIGPFPAGVFGLADNNLEFDIDTLVNVAKIWLLEIP